MSLSEIKRRSATWEIIGGRCMFGRNHRVSPSRRKLERESQSLNSLNLRWRRFESTKKKARHCFSAQGEVAEMKQRRFENWEFSEKIKREGVKILNKIKESWQKLTCSVLELRKSAVPGGVPMRRFIKSESVSHEISETEQGDDFGSRGLPGNHHKQQRRRWIRWRSCKIKSCDCWCWKPRRQKNR